MDIAMLPDLQQVQAALARKNFLDFVKFTWPAYQVHWHHKAIAAQMDKFARGEIKRLMLFVPPQHGKSQLSSRHLPAYLTGLHPDKKIAICSYSDDLAGKFSVDAQRIIESPEFELVFPKTKIPKKGGHSDYSRNADLVQIIGYKGSIKSVGVGNGITGNTVDVAIIDDPIKGRLDANSQTYRDRLWAWYVDELLTRLDNDAQQLLTLTRWHEDDLAGRLLAQDAERVKNGQEPLWTVIMYPAIKEENYTAPDDPRAVGEALWPKKHSAEKILLSKTLSEQTYNSLYQQRPSTPEGNLFRVGEAKVITMGEFSQIIGLKRPVWDSYVDGAYTDKTQNDPSALYTSTMIDNVVYIRKVSEVRLEFDALLARLKDFVKGNGYTNKSTIFVEGKANGLSIVQSTRKNTQLNVKIYKWGKDDEGVNLGVQDKVSRATAVAPFFNSGRVVLIEDGTGWTANFLTQCAAFPNALHDDMVDTMVMDLARRFLKRVTNMYIQKQI